MANEGYLIGYEDAQGNFVQIGQFNNAADDVTQPLVLRHTNSGETLELDGSSFRPSTQIGDTNNRPDVFANTVDLNTLVGAGLDTKADLTQSGGVLVASQLPDLAITNIDVVANQSERLSLTAEEGDVAVQTDVSQTFILATNDPTVDSNWKQVQLDVLGAIDGQTITPAQTGTSTNPTDVEAGNIEAGTIGSSSNRPDLLSDEIDTNRVEADTQIFKTVANGSTTIKEEFNDGSNAIVNSSQKTSTVSTTLTKIHQSQTGGGGSLILVTGRGQNVAGAFTDLVMMIPFGTGPTVINDETIKSPDARTYSKSGGGLELSMAANTYNIITDAIDMEAA